MFHLDFAFLDLIEKICIALWFKFVRVFETLCFSRKSWKVWILSLFTLHFPKGKWIAMPQESSQRFGLRTNKEDAVHRSHDFAEWERLYVARSGEGGDVLTHKDFIVCTLRVYAIGYLQKSIGEVLVRTKPTEYRWRGGIQHKEVMSDGRVLYEITNYERIL